MEALLQTSSLTDPSMIGAVSVKTAYISGWAKSSAIEVMLKQATKTSVRIIF